MSRLLGLSPVVLCSRCKPCARAEISGWSAARAQLLSGGAPQRSNLTLTRRILHSDNGVKRRFWALGIGTGLLLALGLKYHVYSRERCECECEKSVSSQSDSTYSAAIESSRDLLQRIKVQVASQQLYCSVTSPKEHLKGFVFIPECT